MRICLRSQIYINAFALTPFKNLWEVNIQLAERNETTIGLDYVQEIKKRVIYINQK